MTNTNANAVKTVATMPMGLECNQPTNAIPMRNRIKPQKGRIPMPPMKCVIHASLGFGDPGGPIVEVITNTNTKLATTVIIDEVRNTATVEEARRPFLPSAISSIATAIPKPAKTLDTKDIWRKISRMSGDIGWSTWR